MASLNGRTLQRAGGSSKNKPFSEQTDVTGSKEEDLCSESTLEHLKSIDKKNHESIKYTYARSLPAWPILY